MRRRDVIKFIDGVAVAMPNTLAAQQSGHWVSVSCASKRGDKMKLMRRSLG